MKSIIVTGANGQLGQCFRAIAKHNADNFIFLTLKDLDITNKKEVESFFSDTNADWCINCAAYTQVDKAEEDLGLAYNVNANGAKYVAEACLKNNMKLIHVSTDFVFNGSSNIAYTESEKTDPLSEYGKSKLKGEKYIIETISNYFIIRTSWLYSEHGHNFVKTMLRLGAERENLKVVGDQIGSPTYAGDLAKVILKIIKEDIRLYGTYHYSNEGVASWYDFAKAIFDLKDLDCKVLPIKTEAYPTPAKRPPFSIMDKSRIKEKLRVEIPYWRYSLSQAIQKIKI